MKKSVLFVWIIFSFLSLEAEMLSERILPGTRNFLAMRVEFKTDITDLTTGNGRFMIDDWTGHDTVYVLDPIPHDRTYFSSHLSFIDHYWDRASSGAVHVNTTDPYLIPQAEKAYELSQGMRYYSDPDSLDYRLARMIYETVKIAVDSGEYRSDNDGLIIYHAGAGQDFKIDLDDSPFDIPSFYFDDTYLSEYLPATHYAELAALNCTQGVVLPESQNQLSTNIALNGTEILLTGMMLGLPTLYDTEFGRSAAGIYGLMDQGSNLGSGLCPIKPSAFERYLLSSADPIELTESGNYALLQDEIYKLSVSSNEYFLIEFRKNTGVWADSLLWTRDDVNNYLDVLNVIDSIGLIDYTLENGVLTDISDLDVALPTNGLLIWHIMEPETFGENPNSESHPFLNLVEADGGDDIGKWYGSLSSDVNNGWKWDMWFKGNEGYDDNNPMAYKMQWNDQTHPDTRSKENLQTGINIRDFKFYADSVVIQLVLDTPGAFNFKDLVFDEKTTAVSDVYPQANMLIGTRDSSLYLFDGQVLSEVYKQDTAYIRGETALLTYQNSLIQITNTASAAKVAHLVNVGGLVAFDELVSTMLDHPVNLDHCAIYGDSLFLPPVPVTLPSTDGMPPLPRDVYVLDIPAWDIQPVNDVYTTLIPYVQDHQLNYVSAPAAAVMNDTLIYASNSGFKYGGIFTTDLVGAPTYANEHIFSTMIPIHANQDNRFEILALTNFNSESTLSLFNHTGILMDHYPIFGDYTKLRVYYLDGEPRWLVYDPAGRIDVYTSDAELQFSLPAPIDAVSLFLEQMTTDTAWVVTDGSIYPIASDSVYWGYDGKNAAYHNRQSGQTASVIVSSETLIRNGLVYNYPNPIENGRTRFRFFATGAQTATINIYQLSGMYVQTLETQVIDNQWNEILWNVSGLQSGVYIAKIEITDGTKTETYFIKPAILK